MTTAYDSPTAPVILQYVVGEDLYAADSQLGLQITRLMKRVGDELKEMEEVVSDNVWMNVDPEAIAEDLNHEFNGDAKRRSGGWNVPGGVCFELKSVEYDENTKHYVPRIVWHRNADDRRPKTTPMPVLVITRSVMPGIPLSRVQ